MHEAGKGDGRRPMAISDQQFTQRWDLIFGKGLKNDQLLAGDKDSEECGQRIHNMEEGGGERHDK
jgi:hypothetical protein